MILRRIKAHVENENWFAVFLDFCIVVVGVFIGIQVANWNDALKDHRASDRAIVSLQQEIDSNITRLRLHLDRRQARLSREHALALAFADKQDPFTPPPDGKQAIAEIMYFSPLRLGDTTSESLSLSGGVNLIQTQTVVDAVAEFERQLEWIDSQHRAFQTALKDLRQSFRQYFRFSATDDPTVLEIDIDWGGFSADAQAQTAFTEMMRIKALYNSYIEVALRNAGQLCEVLGSETGQPCKNLDKVEGQTP